MALATDSEMVFPGEVESPLQSEQRPKTQPFSSLGRQSSIYSLTLDEFQHTLCESSKNFGSMNMDEFLTSIWDAEENQQAAAAATNNNVTAQFNSNNSYSQGLNDASGVRRGISRQPSLPRQGLISLPAPLSGKTVDEVWSEIQKGQEQQQQQLQQQSDGGNSVQNLDSAPRQQPTFGEMTLEDFLIKAGVAREQCSVTEPSQQQQYGMYPSSNGTSTGFSSGPMLDLPTGSGGFAVNYQTMPQVVRTVGESSARNCGYPPLLTGPPQAAIYSGRMGNGGGYGPCQAMGVVGPVSPVSLDATVANVDNVAKQYGMDIGGLRGRKRIIDGPVEKGVERRQRRMIKNRESAARSRARKQAHTVELEAELSQLKEENKKLKHALAALERTRKQQHNEERSMKAQTKAQKAKERLRVIRRNMSCPL